MADQEPAIIGNRAAVLLTSNSTSDDTVAWRGDPTTGAALESMATLLAGEDLTNNTLGVTQKPVASATYSPAGGFIPANDVDLAVKATSGNFKSFHCTNGNAAVRYFQIHNKASAPAAAEVPVFSFPIPATNSLALGSDFFGENGYFLSTGIAIGISTTAGTFTAATTTDHQYNYTYI